MSFDFPSSPTENQEFTPSGGVSTYIWKSPRWVAKPIAGPPGPAGPAGPTGPAGAPGTTSWTGITDKPSTFAPDPEAVDDRVAGLLTAGTNITLSYNDAGNALTINASGGGASVTISDTAPGSPTAGSLWFESDSGKTFIYYTDANSSQWVQVSGAQGPQGPPGEIDPAVLATKVDVSGDTMTGDLILNGVLVQTRASPWFVLNSTTTTDQAWFHYTRSGIQRWSLLMQGGGETDPQGGSDLMLCRWTNAGGFLDVPLAFTRATGLGTVLADPTAPLGIATKQYVDARVATKITVASSAPGSPAVNDVWIDTT